MAGSIYQIPIIVESAPAANAKILTNDVEFIGAVGSKPGEFTPGDGGIVRVYFSLGTLLKADTVITLTLKGKADLLGIPLKLNADQNFIIKSDAYYRFDIGVEVGDKINFSSSVAISDIYHFRMHKIVFGA